MPNKDFDVLVVGGYCLDLIFTGLPSMPVLGKEIVGKGFTMIPGGAYNCAVQMHRLALKVAWAVDFGTDEFSQFVLKAARQEKMDETCFVHQKKSIRNITISLSYPRERAFVAFYDPEPSINASVKALAGVQSKILFVPGLVKGAGIEAGAILARKRGMKIAIDGNTNQDLSLRDASIKMIIKQADLFLCNREEAQNLTEKTGTEDQLKELGLLCPEVVIKDGGNGSHAIKNGKLFYSPAMKLNPIDTTGAGDSFNAGYVRSWVEEHDTYTNLKWGNIAGGLSTLAQGGPGYYLSCAEIQKYLQYDVK
jgi:sugar/nucleoside kinase (ribokinase family)